MIKTILAAALVLACTAPAAKACVPTQDIMRPCAYQPNFLAGVKTIGVRMHRVKRAAIQRAPEGGTGLRPVPAIVNPRG